MFESSKPRSTTPQATTGRRNYQACLECKKHKVKCHLGDAEQPKPPCVRCRRARLLCVFGPQRKLRTRRSRGNRANAPPPLGPFEVGEPSGPAERTHTQTLDGSSNTPNGAPTTPEDTRSPDSANDLSPWTRFHLCRDGYLNPDEADYLLDHFFRWMHPMYPLADQKYTFARHRAQLIAQEPFLCTTILAITSRYTWFQTGNFSSKATEVHTATYKYVQAEFQRFLWGSGPGRCTEIATLGLIESIMLMVEWHPRSMDLNTPAGDISGGYGLAQYGYDDVPRTSDRSFEAEMRQAWNTFKPVNTTSWWLLSIAINLADGIGLHQVITTGIDHLGNENHTRRARVHEFLVSLVWERSFRLSRKCMLNHPSDTPKQIFVGSDAEPLDEILESRAELYRLIRLVENTIYPNPRHTADIIATGDYHSTVNDFCSLLNGWKTRFDRVKGVSPPLAKHIEIMWHNTRAFLYSIALQAFVTRTNSTLGGPLTEDNGSVPAPRSSNVTQAGQDEIMIGEWIQASECIISVALELHRDGLLRYAPLNVLYHAISGSLALLKVKRLPLQPKNDPMGLLIQLAHALEESSVDDAHFGHRYAVCLKSMIRKMEQGRYQCVVPFHEPTGETSSMTEGMRAMGAGGEASHPTEHGSAGGLGLDVAFGAFGESFQDQLSFLECHDDWTRWLSF